MIRVFDHIDALINDAAERLVAAAEESVRSRGRFILALSGGQSPLPLFQILARPPYHDKSFWRDTFIFWCDERYVPLDDERSNAGTAMRVFLNHVAVPQKNIAAMYIEGVNAEQAAEIYGARVTKLLGADQLHLDLALLGCGKDGHTASLFPGSPVINETSSPIRAVNPPQSQVPRITMTPVLLNLSRIIMFIVYGNEKSEAVHAVIEGPPDPIKYPAQIILPTSGELVWLLDREAAVLLGPDSNGAD
ncbi:6-phosphogluconolactonase, eukaryotic type [Candidatus Zixiibacteriota bacterium]|nr:6-phosphogluconolactonase, eukaryotic type [candidate division Zixibacteria bacterium]